VSGAFCRTNDHRMTQLLRLRVAATHQAPTHEHDRIGMDAALPMAELRPRPFISRARLHPSLRVAATRRRREGRIQREASPASSEDWRAGTLECTVAMFLLQNRERVTTRTPFCSRARPRRGRTMAGEGSRQSARRVTETSDRSAGGSAISREDPEEERESGCCATRNGNPRESSSR